MHYLYDLKEMLCGELEKYGAKHELSSSSLEMVDKLAHAAKNVGKLIEMCEESEEHSSTGNTNGMSYGYENNNRRNNGGMSYARRNQRRDRMGRYSSAGDMMEELRNLMETSPDERTKSEFQRFIDKLEMM